MPKSRSKNGIFILGCIIIGVTGLLLIYGILVVTGVIHLKENKLVFTAESNSKLYDGITLVATKWELTSGNLMSDHHVEAKVSGEITDPGVVASTVSVVIYDGQGADVTDEYEIQCVAGTLQVFGIRLVLYSGSSSKLYDGNELTNSQCVLLEGALMSGHQISLEALGRITEIGKVDNTIKYSIVGSNGKDVSRFYDIEKQTGVLEIQKIPYVVKTESDTKLYDGTPLTCGDYTEYGNLMAGHQSSVKVTGKIVGEGSEPNSATVKITDENGRDVTDLYDVNVDAGTLKVVGPPRKNDSSNGGSGSGGGSGGGSGSGGGAGASGIGDAISGTDLNNSSNDADEKKDVEVFRVTATSGGRILFRTGTFGDYIYHGWEDAPAEPDAAALYYTSRELKENGVKMQTARVESILDYGYLLPYYADEYTVNSALRNYTVGYMVYDHLSSPVADVTVTETERVYRNFVYNNYLILPSDTKAAMLQVLADAGLDASSMSVLEQVAWVENYVKNAATYNLKFEPYPEIVDTAIYFLTEAKEGVCRHYATAATVALRALGIPARYTVGFAADVKANVTTVVTGDKAHAWVEVYIEGLGWIAIDPTGGAGGAGGAGGGGDGEGGAGGGESGDSGDGTEGKINIVLIPKDGKKEYDGTPLTAEQKGHKIEGGTPLYGKDELIVEYGGEITEPGETVGYIISCRAVDENGEDVSFRYNFDFTATSTLKVTARVVKVYSEDSIKVHDYTPLTCPHLASGYEASLLDGHFIAAEFSGSQTEIGMSENIFTAKIVDINGVEVENWEKYYDLQKVYGSLRVVFSMLVFKTDNVTREYDGTPLKATATCEYISGKLKDGHTISYAVTDKSRTEPGSTLNIPSFKVVDREGNDVSYMYALSEEKLGYITVTRIKLKITSGSAEMEYDPSTPGKVLYCTEYSYEGALLSEHTVRVQISGQISSVGYCDNQIDFVTIVDKNGNDISEYYDVETENGTLTVLPPEG